MTEFHPVADLFPLMQGDEYEALKADIAENGLREAIWLHPDGRILDGRNRYRACEETGTQEFYETWDGEGSPTSFVISMNLHRRHLTSSQRTLIALEMLPLLEVEAKKRKQTKIALELPPCEGGSKHRGESIRQVAHIVRVSHNQVSTAKKLQQEAPDLLEQVKVGEMTISKAKRKLSKRKRKATRPQIVESAEKSPRLIVGHAENMPQVESESVDLIITSPPYNLKSEYWPMGGEGREPREDGIGYDDNLSEDEYQAWQLECLAEMYRVAKSGASLFYNHKVRQSEGQIIHPLTWLRESQWVIRQEIIWDRGSTHNHCSSLFWPHDERVYWLTKGKPELPTGGLHYQEDKDTEYDKRRSTVWRFHGPQAGTWHPAPFADELPRRCMGAIGRGGITVLDPFAGSCTTLKVALEYDYDAIGIDVSREYLDRAMEENGWINTI